ncbi:hypothetical protein TMatcc_003744 [Talaromyces marneffei ATCC 18224]
MNGFAAVSRTPNPQPTMKFDIANGGNDLKTADGQKISAPQAYMNSPAIKVDLKPHIFSINRPMVVIFNGGDGSVVALLSVSSLRPGPELTRKSDISISSCERRWGGGGGAASAAAVGP